MRKKGYKNTESPEKMPVTTTGIEMTRGTRKDRQERLTGGNDTADQRGIAHLVMEFIRNSYR